MNRTHRFLLPLAFLTIAAGSSFPADPLPAVTVPHVNELFPPGWWAQPEPLRTTVLPTGSTLWTLTTTPPQPLLRRSTILSTPTPLPDGPGLIVAELDREAQTTRLLMLRGDKPTIVGSLRFTRIEGDLTLFMQQPATASPDGRFFTMPTVQPEGTAVLRADGELVTIYRRCFDPLWHPDGQLLVLRREEDPQRGLQVVRLRQPPQVAFIPGPVAWQPGRWAGRSFWLWHLQWHKRPAPNRRFELTPVLVRVEVKSTALRIIHTLWPLRFPEANGRNSAWLAGDPTSTHASLLVRTRYGTAELWRWDSEVARPVHRVLELPLPLTARGPVWNWNMEENLVLWVGTAPGVPLRLNRRSGRTKLLLHDPHATQLILHAAVLAIQRLIADSRRVLPEPRTKLLPWIWPPDVKNLPAGTPRAYRQARALARTCLELLQLDRPTPPTRSTLEALMYVAYAAEQHELALKVADELEPLLDRPQDRERLLLVRIHCLAGAGRLKEAHQALEAIAQLDTKWYLGEAMDEAILQLASALDEMNRSGERRGSR